MQELVFIIHILSVVGLIVLVLVQHGKGADVGAAFGSGASNTMFGSMGSISFFAKITAAIALVFFITSITLGVMVAKQAKQSPEAALMMPADEAQVPSPVTAPSIIPAPAPKSPSNKKGA